MICLDLDNQKYTCHLSPQFLRCREYLSLNNGDPQCGENILFLQYIEIASALDIFVLGTVQQSRFDVVLHLSLLSSKLSDLLRLILFCNSNF